VIEVAAVEAGGYRLELDLDGLLVEKFLYFAPATLVAVPE
jgi:hypothetical protein